MPVPFLTSMLDTYSHGENAEEEHAKEVFTEAAAVPAAMGVEELGGNGCFADIS